MADPRPDGELPRGKATPQVRRGTVAGWASKKIYDRKRREIVRDVLAYLRVIEAIVFLWEFREWILHEGCSLLAEFVRYFFSL